MGRRFAADEDGRRIAAAMRAAIGDELRTARVGAGLGQAAVARVAGMSRSQYGRIERAEPAGLTLEQVCRAMAALGLRLRVQAYPYGDPARDAGQLRVLGRFRPLLPAAAALRTEVPLPIPGDRRAWDATVTLLGRRAGCEVEMRLVDAQALERKLALKLRDGAVDVLILIVPETPANRAFLACHREELRGLLPLDTREVLRAFRRGELPGANGIVLV